MTENTAEGQQIRNRLKDIHDEKMAIHDRLAHLGFEEASLFKRLSEIEVPSFNLLHTRKCAVCFKPATGEAFGRLHCDKHFRRCFAACTRPAVAEFMGVPHCDVHGAKAVVEYTLKGG